jgi:hypothetical protein
MLERKQRLPAATHGPPQLRSVCRQQTKQSVQMAGVHGGKLVFVASCQECRVQRRKKTVHAYYMRKTPFVPDSILLDKFDLQNNEATAHLHESYTRDHDSRRHA